MGGMLLLDALVALAALVLLPVLHGCTLQGYAQIFAVVGIVHDTRQSRILAPMQCIHEVVSIQVLGISLAFGYDFPSFLLQDGCELFEQRLLAIGLPVVT